MKKPMYYIYKGERQMKMTPIYRVHKANHNPQFFLTRAAATDYAERKGAEVDIYYRRNIKEAQMLVERENQKKW